MIITDLLGARVFGPDFVGFVTDARFRLDTSSTGRPARLYESVSAHMPGPHP